MKRRPNTLKVRFGSGVPVTAIGLPGRPLADSYHLLLTWSWTRLFSFLGLTYVAVNATFAALYLSLGPGAIANARPGSFADTFFFAFDTMATIGYGNMYPVSEAANLLSMVQAMIGLAGMAVTTGLVFAKFARPTARVLFSRVAVIQPFDGVPSLIFRMANARANQIVEAELSLVLTRRERTAEGETIYKVHDLKLRRSRNSVFSLTWMAVHPITPDSPLHGQDLAALQRDDVGLLASVSGLDEHFGQTIHARHAYDPQDLAFGMRFADILLEDERGDAVIDYRRFHEVEPIGGDAAASSGGAPGGGPDGAKATPRDP
jgi:inward rectifier potassium channel